MRSITKEELSSVVGGEGMPVVVIPRKRDDGSATSAFAPGKGLTYSNGGAGRSGGGGAGQGGGSRPATKASELPVTEQVCTDTQIQVCKPMEQVAKFGRDGIEFGNRPGGCITYIKTECVTKRTAR